jgi:hypothetical protein
VKRIEGWRPRAGAKAAGALVFGLVVSACGSERLLGRSEAPGAGASAPSLGSRISNLFGGGTPSQTPASGGVATAAADIECPTVEVRTGSSTLAVSAIGMAASPMSVRYQASFGQTARECKVAGNVVTIRVGIEGRVVLGPAGGPGQIELPVRYAVVREGPEPRTIVTKVHWQPVTIPPGEGNVAFTQIEEDLSFPLPRGNEIDAYVVYVGYDGTASKEPVKKPPAQKPPAKPRRTT